MTIALLGVPTNSSGTTGGVARAPQVLREAGLVDRLERASRLVDLGDVQVDPPSTVRGADGLIDAANLAATLGRVRGQVADARRKGHRLVVVGGDCPVLIGVLAGCADAASATPPALLFVDGHEDAWPPLASTTGEAADMELGLLLGRSIDGVDPGLRAHIPRLDPARVVVLGARDRIELDDAGVPSIDAAVTVLDDKRVIADPAGAAREAVHRLAGDTGWWLHVDLDVLSTAALPAVDYRQAGGLSWSDLNELTGAALSVGGCLGATVTIYDPDLDPERRHASAIVAWIGELAGGLEAQGVTV